MPGDKVLFIISLYQEDSIIALPTDCTFSIDSTISEFACYIFPITYQSDLIPDLASIVVIAGSDTPQIGTEIIVDELSFLVNTGVDQRNALPNSLSVSYPNPAQDNTYIPIHLLKGSEVEVIVWDLKGNLVQSYPFHYLEAGKHELELDIRQLPNGMYAYSVRGEDIFLRSKMVISK